MKFNPSSAYSASLLFLSITILTTACKVRDADRGADTKNVFGEDNRQNWNDAPEIGFPNESIYRIFLDERKCTGSLVASRIILTAAHCVYYTDGPQAGTMVTEIRVRQNTRAGDAPLINVTLLEAGAGRGTSDRTDWAFLLLPTASPAEPFKVSTDNPVGKQAWAVGYSRDREELSFDSDCTIREIYRGALLHDCDGRRGVSGGPVYVKDDDDERTIVGVNSTEGACDDEPDGRCENGIAYTRETANTATPATAFYRALQRQIAQ